MVSRQVSWLTGLRSPSGLPEAFAPVTQMDGGSPLTVAGAAPASRSHFCRNARAHRIPS